MNNERLGWARVSQGEGEDFKSIDEVADPALNPEEALMAKQERAMGEIQNRGAGQDGSPEMPKPEDPTATPEFIARLIAAGPQVVPDVRTKSVLTKAKEQVDELKKKLEPPSRGEADTEEGPLREAA